MFALFRACWSKTHFTIQHSNRIRETMTSVLLPVCIADKILYFRFLFQTNVDSILFRMMKELQYAHTCHDSDRHQVNSWVRKQKKVMPHFLGSKNGIFSSQIFRRPNSKWILLTNSCRLTASRIKWKRDMRLSKAK